MTQKSTDFCLRMGRTGWDYEVKCELLEEKLCIFSSSYLISCDTTLSSMSFCAFSLRLATTSIPEIESKF